MVQWWLPERAGPRLQGVALPWQTAASQTLSEVNTWFSVVLGREVDRHEVGVAELALCLAQQAGLIGSSKQARQVVLAGILHDIGKAVVSSSIVEKAGPLSAQEMAVMRQHPILGWHLASTAPGIDAEVLSAVLHHHEQWNGEGYPSGLIGESIPVLARVLKVVDVYDALVTDRPYRAAWLPDEALGYLRRSAGVQFEPRLVDVFVDQVATAMPRQTS